MLLTAAVWAATGAGTYLYIGSHRGTIAAQARTPGEARSGSSSPLSRLPGTMYIVQQGTLYRLQGGAFTALLQSATWTQPAVAPSGQSLLVVRRDYDFSDLYLVDTAGHVQAQLTHDANRNVQLNHWAFYPRFSADGGQVFFSYDAKDRFNSYDVVLSIYQMPVRGSFGQARKWTTPEPYTGGDLQPIPLGPLGVIYTKYTFDQATNRILSQVWLTPRIGAVGRPLTDAAADCSQPSLAPDGRRLALICTGGTQFASVEVASFDGASLGPRQVLVGGQLAAQPTWAPDDSGLVYLAPQGLSGHFELWFQPLPPPPPPTPTAVPANSPTPRRAGAARPTATPSPPTPSPSPPRPPAAIQLTTDLDFDATSTIAWHL